jgi:hypothetical protein
VSNLEKWHLSNQEKVSNLDAEFVYRARERKKYPACGEASDA